MDFAPAPGTVDKPAHISGLEFIGRTPALLLFWAFQKILALLFLAGLVLGAGEQEIDLPLHMAGNLSPSLFIAVYCFNGYPQKLGHLFLGTV
jgi:hypothetical protein